MELKQMICPSCGGSVRVPTNMERITCEYCAKELVVEHNKGDRVLSLAEKITGTFQDVGLETQGAIRENTGVTQAELQRLQIGQQIGTLQIQISNIKAEIRALEREKQLSQTAKRQLKELRNEEQECLRQIRNLESFLSGGKETHQTSKSAKVPAGKRPPWLWGVLLVLLFCCCCPLAIGPTSSNREVTLTAVEQNWERTTAVESYQTVTEKDWELPAEARLISQQQKIQRYEQVITGYKNGSRQVSEQVQVGTEEYSCGERDEDVTCTRPIYETQTHTETVQVPIYWQEPVYETQYQYEIDKWVVVRVEEANGRGTNPAWPQLTLAENEREGERTERYWLVFVDEKEGYHEKEFPLEVWQQFREGGEYTGVLDASDNLQEVSP